MVDHPSATDADRQPTGDCRPRNVCGRRAQEAKRESDLQDVFPYSLCSVTQPWTLRAAYSHTPVLFQSEPHREIAVLA